MRNEIKFRIFLWLVLFGVVAWILYLGVVPGGKIAYLYDFDKESSFIGKLNPKERVDAPVNGMQRIIGDPVYFNLQTSRSFDRANIKIRYQNPDELPLLEAGVLVDNTIWRYDLEPMENRQIDQVALAWDKQERDGILFLQREKKFNALEEFLENPPLADEIAVYNYDLDVDYVLPGYTSAGRERVIEQDLRGPWEVYTYIKDENLDFSFVFVDLNQNKDSDELDINLYYRDELVESQRLEDDGVGGDKGEESLERIFEFKLANLPEGVYKLELRANDDIITKRILTKQSKLAWRGSIWLASEGNTGISLFTDSRMMHVKTTDPASLQDIKAGENVLSVSETYRQFSASIRRASSSDTFATTTLARDGLIIAGNGVFAFSPDELINPRLDRADGRLDVNGEGINYIVAKYKQPEKFGDWLEASFILDMSRAYREKGRYSFIISIPGLRADDEKASGIIIDKIQIELEGKTLWQKTKELIGKIGN